MNKQNKQNIKKRKIEGTVISDKMNKTVVVEVQRFKKHPLYHKVLKVSKRFKVHNENNEARIGDKVLIEETRPLSKEKKWKLIQIIKKSENKNSEEIVSDGEKNILDDRLNETDTSNLIDIKEN